MQNNVGIYASQISGHLWAPNGAYDALATITVPSGGVASIEFAGIPQGYKHLELRGFAKTNRATYASDSLLMQFNSDTAANYSEHGLFGDGTGAGVYAYANTASFPESFEVCGTGNGSGFGASIHSILDYTSTSKYKTVRTLGGFDTNGTVAGYGGHVGIGSGNWRSLSPINSIKLTPQYGSLILQYSQFSLYGIK